MAGGEPTRAQRSFAALIVLGLLLLFVAVVAVDFFASPNPDGGTPPEVSEPGEAGRESRATEPDSGGDSSVPDGKSPDPGEGDADEGDALSGTGPQQRDQKYPPGERQ